VTKKLAKAKLERGKVKSRLEKAKMELDNIAVPLKRLRCKQPLKREELEPATPLKLVSDAAEDGQTAGTAEAEGLLPPVTSDLSAAQGGDVSQQTHPEPSPKEQVAQQGHLEPFPEKEAHLQEQLMGSHKWVPAVDAVTASLDLATAAASVAAAA